MQLVKFYPICMMGPHKTQQASHPKSSCKFPMFHIHTLQQPSQADFRLHTDYRRREEAYTYLVLAARPLPGSTVKTN